MLDPTTGPADTEDMTTTHTNQPNDGSYPITVDEMTVAVFPGFARVTVTKVIIAESAGAYAVTVDNPEHVIIPDSVYPSEFVTTGEEAHDFLAACAVAAYWSNQIYEANV